MRPVELSIVVLCFGAEGAIVPFVEQLKITAGSITESWQLVLVGNYIEGSADLTKDIVSNLAAADPRIKAITKPKKGMMGWDMRKGLNAAEGRYLCVIDGDGQFPVSAIGEGYRLLTGKDLDLVKTYRVSRSDGVYRSIVSGIYNCVFRIMFPGLGSRDINSKPKIFTRSAFERMTLRSDDWFVDAEIMLNVRRFGLRFEEYPIAFAGIESRRSFVKPRALLEFARNLARYWAREFFDRDA